MDYFRLGINRQRRMNNNQIKFLERLIANAQGEIYLATLARNLEEIERLQALIVGYELKIKEMSK